MPETSAGAPAAPPIVFLHGWAGSGLGTWTATNIPDVMQRAGRTCFVPDLPGHGVSARARQASHDPADYDDIVDRVQAQLPSGPVDLVGYSLGAKIALIIAAREPARVRRMVAVAVGDNIFAAESSGGPLGDLLAGGLAADTPERLRRMAIYAFQSGADPLALAACLRRHWEAPSPERLGHITAPVLLALAEHDELVKSADRLRAALPTVDVRTLDGQDHLSAPFARELAPMIADFLQ